MAFYKIKIINNNINNNNNRTIVIMSQQNIGDFQKIHIFYYKWPSIFAFYLFKAILALKFKKWKHFRCSLVDRFQAARTRLLRIHYACDCIQD